jgi:hypothetical protein
MIAVLDAFACSIPFRPQLLLLSTYPLFRSYHVWDDSAEACEPFGVKSVHVHVLALATPWLSSLFQWYIDSTLFGRLDIPLCVK